MKRRHFLAAASTILAAPVIANAAAENKKLRVAVIGHTARGNYGHGLDTVWLNLPETEIVAVADAEEAGRAAALKKLGIDRGFGDYREMLAAAKPDITAVCPRFVDEHHDMI